MKRIVLLAFLGAGQLLYARECCSDWMLLFKQGYFYPSSCTLRQQFKNSGSKGGYFAEGDLRYRCWGGLFFELNASYFSHKGRAIVTGIATPSCPAACTTRGECFTVKLPALGLGLKYFFSNEHCSCIEPFLGIGMKAFFARVNNGSPYVPQNEKLTGIGGVFSGGLLYYFYTHGLLELFVDYQHKTFACACRINCNCPSVSYQLDIRGVVAGVGIGVEW